MTPAEIRASLTPIARRREWCLRVSRETGPIRPVLDVMRYPSDDAVAALLRHLEYRWSYVRRLDVQTPALDVLVPEGWALLGRLRLSPREEIAA